MRNKLLFLLAGCVGLILSGCAPQSAESLRPLADGEIVGIWRQGGTVYHLQFNADGTFRSAESVAGLETDPIDFGMYQLDGTRFTFMSNAESLFCPGHTGVYEIQLDGEGRIVLERLEEECPDRRTEPIPRLSRVSP